MTLSLFTTLVMHLCNNIETLISVAGCVLYDFDILENVSPLNFTYNLKENLWEAMYSNECEKFFVSNGKRCIP